MNLIYYTGICSNILYNYYNLHTTRTMYLFHIYFYTMIVLVWRGELLVNNFLIHFITDLFNEFISKRLTTFTIFHHTLVSIICLVTKLSSTINIKFIDLCAIYEISTIPRALFEMGHISKPVYNILFSYSFIFIRLIYFNYTMYNTYLSNSAIFTNTVIIFYILMNVMNFGIAWKMKLVQKLFVIQSCLRYNTIIAK